MFQRFTERARQAIVLAHDEARLLKQDHIGTEHLLLGVLREEEGLGARILESLHVTVESVRARVREGAAETTGQIPFTPRAKKVLELSLREALALGHDYIGTEHLLLGLARVDDGVAARILSESGADEGTLRAEMLRLLPAPADPPDRPDAGPVDEPEIAELLEMLVRLGRQQDDAIYAGDDERLRELREQEHVLLELSGRRLAARAGDEPEEPVAGRARRRPMNRGVLASVGAGPLVLSWLLGVATLGLGILLGWAIWG